MDTSKKSNLLKKFEKSSLYKYVYNDTEYFTFYKTSFYKWEKKQSKITFSKKELAEIVSFLSPKK